MLLCSLRIPNVARLSPEENWLKKGTTVLHGVSAVSISCRLRQSRYEKRNTAYCLEILPKPSPQYDIADEELPQRYLGFNARVR